ncbi:hypothetical protein ACEPAI_2432 [Sanghuangporus weigelae]
MTGSEERMRSEVSFHRILQCRSRGPSGPRLGRLTVKKPGGSEIKIDTPGIITSTSRGVVPHLTRDHVQKADVIRWVHMAFETFLERTPPIPTLIDANKSLETLAGLQEDRHVLSMSLRDPHDVREMPPNGNKFTNANCIRGVRKVTPEQYRSFVHICNPDLTMALSDIPFTPPPFSQRRITKSLERSTSWLSAMLSPVSGVTGDRHHPSNIFVQMVGDVSRPARRTFAESLNEKLLGKEAEQVKPFKCLDDGVFGYAFDLVPLRTSLLVSDKLAPDDEDVMPNRRTIDSKPLTQPRSEEIIPKAVDLLRASLEPLSPDKPRLVTGASSPHEVLHLIRDIGIDAFDVSWAQKAADWGIALDFVFPVPKDGALNGEDVRADGKRDLGHNLYSSKYTADFSRLSHWLLDGSSQTENATNVCPCIACSPRSTPSEETTHASVDILYHAHATDADRTRPSYDPPFSRAYIHHLLHTHEMSAHTLLAAHNLAVADAFFAAVRRVLSHGAAHKHHPHSHAHGVFHADLHPETETFVSEDMDAHFSLFEQEVESFCATYDSTLRLFGEAKRDWISVDYARGKGRLAREKAKQAQLVYRLVRPLFSPLRNLRSPPSTSLIYGNVNEVRRASPLLEEWYKKYGKVMKCKGRFGEDQLFTIDTRAINHILTHSFDYQKTKESRFFLSRLLGNGEFLIFFSPSRLFIDLALAGILVTEAEKHKQQNPSFSTSSIRDVTPIFFEKALRMRDVWETDTIAENRNTKEVWTNFEVLSWMSRATLDIIGLAGFHHDFNSLGGLDERESRSDSLNDAISLLLRSGDLPGFLTLLKASFPIFRIIPDKRSLTIRKARNTMLRLGEELLLSRQRGGVLEKGRDLLSVLVRANMDAELPVSQRMNNEDVLAQVPTFLIAGHETTSNQMSWALFELARYQDLQARLREELRSVPTDIPSADDLSPEKLPFLEKIVRETCRLHGAVSSIVRIATKDDIIPVEEPYTDRNGKVCHEIGRVIHLLRSRMRSDLSVRVGKGDGVMIPILALNRAKHIWGDDAAEFNPDRWASPPAAAKSIPGLWSDLMTFSGGPRSCIGFRFALVEMKVILFTLIRRFEFSLALPAEHIGVRSVAFLRPSVRGEKGAQLPLLVKICEE